MADVAAIVLAGGGSRRLGRDKLAEPVGGMALLDRVLDALPAMPVVAVGPARTTAREVRWTSESPAGGGPLAGLAAGLEALPAEPSVVLVLAGDLPAVGDLPARLVAALAACGGDAAVALGPDQHPQPLLAAYRREALQWCLDRIGDPSGRPVRLLLEELSWTGCPATAAEVMDCDDEHDLERMREALHGPRGVHD